MAPRPGLIAVPALRRFVLATFLWLPACFALWSWSSPVHTEVLGWLARWGMGLLPGPGVLSAVERTGHELAFVSSVEVPGGVLVGEVNALAYSYGLPVYFALCIAGRAPLGRTLAGAAVLLPVVSACICFAFLVQFLGAGPAIAAAAGITGWKAEAVALAYQLGTLLVPGLAPIAAWSVANREWIGAVAVPARQARKGAGRPPHDRHAGAIPYRGAP